MQKSPFFVPGEGIQPGSVYGDTTLQKEISGNPRDESFSYKARNEGWAKGKEESERREKKKKKKKKRRRDEKGQGKRREDNGSLRSLLPVLCFSATLRYLFRPRRSYIPATHQPPRSVLHLSGIGFKFKAQ